MRAVDRIRDVGGAAGRLDARRTARLLDAGAVPELRPILGAWLTARVCVGIATVLVLALHQAYGMVLLEWDGGWYRKVAEFGYGGVSTVGLRYFPLYPMLSRIVGWPFRRDLAGLIILSHV